MQRKRGRILMVVLLPLGLLLSGLCFLPLPHFTGCEGVTWAPEESRIHAGADGFITEILTGSGESVVPGTVLLRSENPQLDAQTRLLEAQLAEYHARYRLSLQNDRTESSLLKEELARIEAELARAREQQKELVLQSNTSGIVVLPQEEDLPGRFLRRGTPVGYILNQQQMRVRVLVPQADVERVRGDTQKVEIRLAEQISTVYPATVIREVPAASRELPSLALSLEGGGRFVLDPRESDRPMALERLFQFDIQLAGNISDKVEERVFVRFEHSPEPLAWRWYRGIRRLLLSRFAI